MGVLSWALDRFANATADPTIPAQDGASARAFADMVRGLMSGARALADDQGGALVTAGSANAYTVKTASGVGALRAGLSLLIQIDRTNTGQATLNVDGTGPSPWCTSDGADFAAGYLTLGNFVRATWDVERAAWISDLLAPTIIGTAVQAWFAGLPTSSAGLGPGAFWRNGTSAEGYVLSQTGTNG